MVEQAVRFGERGAQPEQQRVHGVGIDDVQAGQREVAHPGVGAQREQHARGPGDRAAVGERHGQGAQLVAQPRHGVDGRFERRVHRPPPVGRSAHAEEPVGQLGGAHPVHAQLGEQRRRPRDVGRDRREQAGQDVGEQGGQLGSGQVEDGRGARGHVGTGRTGQPRRVAQDVQQQLPQAGVELGAREPGRGHEREPGVGCDGRHEVEVGTGGGVQDGVGGVARADAAAVRVERDVRDQPGGQAQTLGGGGGSVQDVVAERGRTAVGIQRESPAERPHVPCAMLGRGVRRALRGPADQQPAPGGAVRAADPDDRTAVLRASRRHRGPEVQAADDDLDEVGQREQQVRCGGRRGGEQRVRVEAGAQRQANLRRVAVGQRRLVRARRPHQPQHRQLPVAAGQLGGRAGQLADGVRGRRGRERDAAVPGHDPGRVGQREHRGEADPEPPHRSRVVPLRRGPQRGERTDARGVQRCTGVRDVQLGVPTDPAVDDDPEPSRDARRAGGVGGVLRQLDAPRVGVSAEPQVLLGVRVFPEPGGRVGPGGEHAGPQRSRTERIAADVGRHREPAGSRSTPSS